MADVRNDPSMEDILASIKRIIADDTAVAMDNPRARSRAAARPAPVAPAPAAGDEVLELTQEVAVEETAPPRESAESTAPQPPMIERPAAWPAFTPPAVAEEPELISTATAEASRQAFATLASRVAKPAPSEDQTLEGLVREMLRPMLKEWLDARLPELVEGVVQREIARIAGRTL